MTIHIGTGNYRSIAEARKNYNGDIDEALKEGRVEIGKPEIQPGRWLTVTSEGRYIINVPEGDF